MMCARTKILFLGIVLFASLQLCFSQQTFYKNKLYRKYNGYNHGTTTLQTNVGNNKDALFEHRTSNSLNRRKHRNQVSNYLSAIQNIVYMSLQNYYKIDYNVAIYFFMYLNNNLG